MGEIVNTTTTTVSTDINALSDKELFNILNLLPIPDLIRVELVCKRFQFIQEIVCRNKTELSLYVPSYRAELKHFSEVLHWSNQTFATKFTDFALCVRNESLSRSCCEFLLDKFPNVKSLNLFGVRISTVDLGFLLQHWPNLEQIALVFGPGLRINWDTNDWIRFWQIIEPVQSLKRLALPFRCERLDLLYQNVMSRLESLHLSIGYDFNGRIITELFDSITPNLRRLSMTDVYHDVHLQQLEGVDSNFFNLEHKFKTILEQKPEIFTQLTHLGWHFRQNSGVDKQLLAFICSKFTSLISLDLNTDCYLSLVQMVPHLAQLRHLTSLRIKPQQKINIDEFEDVDSQYGQSDVEDNNNEQQHAQVNNRLRSVDFFSELTSQSIAEKVPTKLESIRHLYLADFDFSEWSFFGYLHYVFPNIETLHFENCEFPLKRTNPEVNRRYTLLQKLKQFESLKRVYRNKGLLLKFSWLKHTEEDAAPVALAVLKELFKSRPKVQLFAGIYDHHHEDVFADLYVNGDDYDQLLAQGNENIYEGMHIDDDDNLEVNAPGHYDFNYDFDEHDFGGF